MLSVAWGLLGFKVLPVLLKVSNVIALRCRRLLTVFDRYRLPTAAALWGEAQKQTSKQAEDIVQKENANCKAIYPWDSSKSFWVVWRSEQA